MKGFFSRGWFKAKSAVRSLEDKINVQIDKSKIAIPIYAQKAKEKSYSMAVFIILYNIYFYKIAVNDFGIKTKKNVAEFSSK